MSTILEFKVTIELEKSEGKFASKDELLDLMKEALEDADPGSISCENEGIYDTLTWDVEAIEQKVKHK